MVSIMPPHASQDIPSKIEELRTSLSQCQTMFDDFDKRDEHKKAELNALENSFVSTTTEMCEQLTTAHSNQAVSDTVAYNILDTANDIARHVSEKKPIPPEHVEQILDINSDNITHQAQVQHQKSQTNAIIKLLKKMAILATTILTIIFPGPGTTLGLSVQIGAALVSFLPDAFEAYKSLFQNKQIPPSSDQPENLELENAKQLQHAYKQENKEQREHDPEEIIKKENNNYDGEPNKDNRHDGP